MIAEKSPIRQMHSLRHLYRIGNGPSSSHTLAPRRAAGLFCEKHSEAASFRVTLFGSLGATGRGHLTDKVLIEAFAPEPVEIIWRPEQEQEHPNAMLFEAFSASGEPLGSSTYFSMGGGALLMDLDTTPVYPHGTIREIMDVCNKRGISYWQYAAEQEGQAIWEFLDRIWQTMIQAIQRGLAAEGTLPGELHIPRKASSLWRKASVMHGDLCSEGMLAAYAYAVAEENAAGEVVVTAPTCGSSGVIPAVLYHLLQEHGATTNDVLKALATAGIFGNTVKHQSSISGAVVGCQGEIGTACAMASAAAAQILGGTLEQIEYAAEMGLEHHLGLTCDPVYGLVQIPCIERNAHAATRSMSCCRFALLSDGHHRISFDDAVAVMDETGRALPSLFRETAMGGLAQMYLRRIEKENSPDS